MGKLVKQEVLMNAVFEQQSMPDRAESIQKAKDHQKLFVDNPRHNIAHLMSGRKHQILFGRRGTGKTMLLQELLWAGQPYNPDADYLAIMIPAYDFRRSPDALEKDPVVVRARGYFRSFLEQVADRILGAGDRILKNEDLLSKLGLKNRVRYEILQDRMLKLNHVLRYGVPHRRLLQTSRDEKFEEVYSSDESTRVHGGVGLEGGIADSAGLQESFNLPELRANIGGGIQGSAASAESVNVNRYEHVRAGVDLGIPEMRTLIREILETLKLQHLMILIDEWETLHECQAEFAEYLKSCFIGIPFVSIKIAAYRHVCRFNNQATREKFRGFELGQDISEAGDTDLPPRDPNTKKFFFEVLYRRLLYKRPELASFYGEPSVFDYEQLALDVCRNAHAAEMLARGAHGISRDFISAFNIASCIVNYDVARERITLENVRQSHGELSRKIQENIHASDDIGGLLFELIRPHVRRTGAPFFFMRRRNDKWDELLWELIEKRAIHVIPSTDMPLGSDVDWRGFEVSYGLFEEWGRAMMFADPAQKSRPAWKDIEDMDIAEFENYVLQIEQRPSSVIVCIACKKQFSTSDHSYIVARRCSHCYVAQDEPLGEKYS